MRNKKNNEKLIVLGACIITVLVVVGFTFIQGNLRSKAEEHYVSKQSNVNLDTNLSKNDYEVIKEDNKDNISKYIILEKRNLSSEEIVQLTKQIVKNNKNFEIYIFNDKEKSKQFDYNKNEIEILVKLKERGKLNIQNYYLVEKEIKSIPQYYSVESIKEKDNTAIIDLDLEENERPEKVLSQIKFLGQSIKDLNKDKKIENLDIKAYYKDIKEIKWEYKSEDKNLIIHNEIVQF